MSSIPAIAYPSWDDLGRTTEQRLTGSVDHKKARTACSRLNHFFAFLNEYGQLGRYLTNNRFITNEIIGRFTTFLLSGFTIQCISILVSTIKGYLRIVNRHFHESGCNEPWDPDDNSDASILLREQLKFEKEPARRLPLDDKVIVKMRELSRQDRLGFNAAVFDFTALGEYGGFFTKTQSSHRA